MEFLASIRPGIQASPSGGEQNLLCCAAPGLEISRDCDTDIIFSDLIFGRGDIEPDLVDLALVSRREKARQVLSDLLIRETLGLEQRAQRQDAHRA